MPRVAAWSTPLLVLPASLTPSQIAVEGCGHGELDRIYETMQALERREGKKIDLLICCGDFQVRLVVVGWVAAACSTTLGRGSRLCVDQAGDRAHERLDATEAGASCTAQHISCVNMPAQLPALPACLQAVRNMDDLECMACPPKYRHMATFYKYYSGAQRPPYPTLFSEPAAAGRLREAG